MHFCCVKLATSHAHQIPAMLITYVTITIES